MKNILLLMHRFPISGITDAVGMLLVVAFLAIASLNWHEVNELKIGGPRYSRIVDAKDLVADILPPPMYIVEAFLEANILVGHPDQLPVRSSALSRLKSEYDAERQRWSQADLPASMKSTLLVGSHREVELFWRELNDVFTPSIAQGKRAEAAASLGRLAEHFEGHRMQILALVGDANGYLANAETDARQAEKELRTISLTLSALILAVFVGLTVATRYVVTNPLATVAHRMTSLIKGELTVDIPFQERSNEIGAMATSLVVFRDAMTEKARMEREEEDNRRKLDDERLLREQEKTDASTRQVLALRAMVETVERETKTAVGGIVALMQDMTGVSREMSETAGRLSVDSESVAEAADQTLNAMRQTSKTTAELAASIERVAGQVQSTRTATLTSVSASKGASEAIHHVAESVDAIGGFAGVITEIALKTKLLALNAGVEAARSGEHGLGFAIIAREVKDLSDQTSKATESINDVIGRVKGTTALALSAVNDIVRSIEAVEKTSGEMAKAVDQQVAATKSIATNVTETERSTAGVTAKIQKVAADASASGHQAADVDTASQDVSAQVNQLQQLLVKIVRTSSEHVDRRSSARVDMDCAATLEIGKKTLSVRLLNLSTGGAMLAHRHGSTGDRVTLVVPGLTGGLDAVIVGNTTNATRLQFDIQPGLSSLLFQFLEAMVNRGEKKAAA